MGSFLLVISLVGLFVLISIFLPWIHRGEISDLQNELRSIKRQLLDLLAILEKNGISIPHNIANNPSKQTQYDPVSHQPTVANNADTAETASANIVEEQPETKPFVFPEPESSKQKKEKVSFEQQFGARLPVWIGGIALALAGFFMVKYSIETGLLSPTVRVVLGLVFGAGMLYSANWIRNKPEFANGTRIAQALSGAGIADLYVCIFAATNLYKLVPPPIGFIGMAVVTAIAVVLSLRHGMPIALLGLMGGFLTPAMIGSNNPHAPTLFIYLYFVVTGLMFAIRKKGWWALSIPTVISAFIWVCLWIFGDSFAASDTIYLGLFLLAISATVVAASKHQFEEDGADMAKPLRLTALLNYFTLAGALTLIAVIAVRTGFGSMECGFFGLLSIGGIGLAYFNQRLYGLVPWLAMAVNAIMLVAWNTPDKYLFALTAGVFGALYIASGYLLQSRSERPLVWSGLTSAASLLYFFIGYFELRHTDIVSGIQYFWGGLALAFSAFGTYALINIIKDVPENHPQKQILMAIYAATSTAFLSIALTIELQREFLSIAFATQLFAIAWINTKIDVKALRSIAGLLACVFGFLLAPQILLLFQITLYSLVEAKLYLQQNVPIVNWPLLQLGLPALFFAVSSYLLRVQKDDRLVRSFEVAAIALFGVMGYYLTRHAFHVDENVLFVKAGFIERSAITNILFVYGLACLWLGRRLARKAVSLSGLTLVGIAVFRIGYFDMFIYNPLGSAQAVGETPILNSLLLTYGLPILWIWRAIFELPPAYKAKWSKYGYGFILLLAFSLITLSVRQVFHGTYLNGNEISNAEIYSYSVAWLLFGIGLLFLGTLRRDKMIRVASLIIMIFTVGKVFLYDASELQGLFRVFSFFGLGLSLLCLSWFYTKFIFGSTTQKEIADE